MVVTNSASGSAPEAPTGGQTSQFGDDRFSMGVETAPGAAVNMGAFGLIGLFNQPSVSPKIEAYLKEVTEEITNIGSFKEGVSIRRVMLQNPASAQAYVATDAQGNKYASIILFADSMTPLVQNNMPSSMYKEVAAQALNAAEPGVHIANLYVIIESDVVRSKQMARCLIRDLLPLVHSGVRDMQLHNLKADAEYIIDSSVDSARVFENRHSPHDVRPRIDMGFTISIRKPRSGNQFNMPGPDMSENQTIMSVGAFVDVLGPYIDSVTGIQKFQPVIRISDITSLLPLAGAALLALTAATQHFISEQGWKRPFSKFGKGTPNLGNLITEEGGDKPWHIPDPVVMERFIQSRMYPPLMAVDVVTGRSRVPAMFLFDSLTGYTRLSDESAKFFNQPLERMNSPICTTINRDYIGAYGQAGGVMKDTRDVTYLDVMATAGSLDPNTQSKLMNYVVGEPAARAAVVSAVTGGFTSLFEVSIVMINAEYLVWISKAVQTTGLRLLDPNAQTNIVPLASFNPQYGNFNGFTSIFQQPGRVQTFTGQTIFG